MDRNQRLGERVKAARIEQRWTVQGASREAGIARDTWKRVEAGASVHDTSRAAVLRFLGLDDDGEARKTEPDDAPTEGDRLDRLEELAETLLAEVRSYRRTPGGQPTRGQQEHASHVGAGEEPQESAATPWEPA